MAGRGGGVARDTEGVLPGRLIRGSRLGMGMTECVCWGGGMAPYYRGRPAWVCRWVREAGPCASENDTCGVCTGALRVRHPH